MPGPNGEPSGMSVGAWAVTRALQHGHVARNRLIRVVIGLIGGRSTWSQALVSSLGAIMIRTLELTADVADFGDQPEYFVSGIKSVSRVGHGVVRVTYYTEREGD